MLRRSVRSVIISSFPYLSQYGLVGSTEWGEDFADWIQEHVVSYVNVGTLFVHIVYVLSA
jgi:N-acetylated-alpha-linked acidic dipeptidase